MKQTKSNLDPVKGIITVKNFNNFNISKVLSNVYVSEDTELPTSSPFPKSRKRIK